MHELPWAQYAEWAACRLHRAAHTSQGWQHWQRMRRLPYAQDRTDHCRCECQQPHLSFRDARPDGCVEDSERLQCLSYRQDDSLGERGPQQMERSLALAHVALKTM